MTLTLTNTLKGKKEPFVPANPNHVTMYVCGPTVYNFAHIGNARPAVVFDVLYRVLKKRFEKVVYARNYTDVDDKINTAATKSGLPISSITERFIEAYQFDMTALGVLAPDLEPRVTEHIPDIINMAEQLIAHGHAYAAEGHVLFDVPSFPAYGALSGRDRDEMIAGARVEVAPYKKDPADFVLWKPSTPDLPGWDSPWGRGRPGWHIECSAMIEEHLGNSIDIHGGGQDLIFPHHEVRLPRVSPMTASSTAAIGPQRLRHRRRSEDVEIPPATCCLSAIFSMTRREKRSALRFWARIIASLSTGAPRALRRRSGDWIACTACSTILAMRRTCPLQRIY